MHQAVDEPGGDEPRTRPVRAAVAYDTSMSSGLISDSRDFVRSFLVHLESVCDAPVSRQAMATAQIVVSELVTNALKYARGSCLVQLEAGADSLEVAVWDSSPVLPVVRQPDPGRVGQHGLEIVKALCRSVESHSASAGKWVRAVVALTD
ncbi:ATP-binding protein [Streptomyces sp. NPDC005526]|uniref:ATP-binding protein n=1 Tax=unclassified Streptomyces TaxID=2593676 RepID=UPI0033A2F440